MLIISNWHSEQAVLGFVKVLVLTIEVKDLQNFLAEIVNRVLPWSSVSQHHFRAKVRVILFLFITTMHYFLWRLHV